jgi:hypothetical protein
VNPVLLPGGPEVAEEKNLIHAASEAINKIKAERNIFHAF